MKKFGKKVLAFTALSAGAATVAYTVKAAKVFRQVALPPKPATDGVYRGMEITEDAKEWAKFTQVDSISATARDGVTLHAFSYRQEKPTHRWVIAQHGWLAKAQEMVTFAKAFFDRGYNVLLPDLRAHGQSGGNYVGWGALDRFDLLVWVDEIVQQDKDAEIVLFGHSLGASVVLSALGEKANPNIRCAIADSAFSSAEEQMTHSLEKDYPKTVKYIVALLDKMLQAKAGYSLKDSDQKKALARNAKPVLLLCGTQDQMVPMENSHCLYESADGVATLVELAGGRHLTCHNCENYWESIDAFLQK